MELLEVNYRRFGQGMQHLCKFKNINSFSVGTTLTAFYRKIVKAL
jgi:hypothetical protein